MLKPANSMSSKITIQTKITITKEAYKKLYNAAITADQKASVSPIINHIIETITWEQLTEILKK